MKSTIERIKTKIVRDGYKRGDTMFVGRRTGLRLQWEIFDKSPLVGDVAWLRQYAADIEHPNVFVNGVRVAWEMSQ